MSERIICLEEHFAPAELNYKAGRPTVTFAKYRDDRLVDIENLRLPEMDECGIALQVLSMTWPGVQSEPDTKRAVMLAQACNDSMAKSISAHPDRFKSFAALPCQDPNAAAAELERCVRELGFLGALINGHTNGEYLDDEKFSPIWERASELHVPIYLHPTPSPAPFAALRGYPELANAAWGWTSETGSHALRLICSGLFDRYPDARVILGHMGEFLPFNQWRLDDRLLGRIERRSLEKRPSEYVRDNFYVTTAGVESLEPLICTVKTLGTDRVMFSVDYPHQYMRQAVEFITNAPIDSDIRERLCYRNAEALFGL